MNEDQGRVVIDLPNGYKLVAEQNLNSQFDREIYISVYDRHCLLHQHLATVRNSYTLKGDKVVWEDGQFDVLVFGNEDDEHFTDSFSIDLRNRTTDQNELECCIE